MKRKFLFFFSLIAAIFVNHLFAGNDEASIENGSLEFKRIYFFEGEPLRSKTLNNIDSILDQEQLQVLWSLLEALKKNPVIGAEIMGFADKHECRSINCRELSLRRAKLVFDWFLNHGIPAVQLKGPLGESTDWPLDSGDTEEGRGLNRRVQLEPYVIEKAEP